jgi:hypothetical protein
MALIKANFGRFCVIIPCCSRFYHDYISKTIDGYFLEQNITLVRITSKTNEGEMNSE